MTNSQGLCGGSDEILDEKGPVNRDVNTMSMLGTVADRAGSPVHTQVGKKEPELRKEGPAGQPGREALGQSTWNKIGT